VPAVARPAAFLSPLDRVLFLRTLRGFEHLGAAELSAVAQQARERVVARGAQLAARDTPADRLFFISDGRIELSRPGRASSMAGPSETIGLLELLAGTTYRTDATAVDESVVFEVDVDGLLDVCEDHFAVLRQNLRFLAQRYLHELRRLPTGTRLGLPASPMRADPTPDLVERLRLLTTARVFSDCNLDALLELARYADTRVLAPDSPIWQGGDPARDFLLVIDGSLRATFDPADQVLVFGPGIAVGMQEAVAELPRSFALVAQDRAIVLRIAVDPFLDLLEDYFEMARDVTAAVAARVIDLEEQRRRR
jgi:CRP-like cAMP-binding protein